MDKRGERSTAYPRGRRARLSAVRLRVHVWMNERNETVKAQSGLRQVMAVKNKKKKKKNKQGCFVSQLIDTVEAGEEAVCCLTERCSVSCCCHKNRIDEVGGRE